MPMFRTCMFPTTTPIKPASASTPLAIISARIHAARRLPWKTGAANNIESAKNTSQPTMSRAYATEGHSNEKTSGCHGCPLNSGWRLKVKIIKCRLQVTPASRAMKITEVRLRVFVYRRPSVHRHHQRDHRRHHADDQDLEDRDNRFADRLLRRLERR